MAKLKELGVERNLPAGSMRNPLIANGSRCAARVGGGREGLRLGSDANDSHPPPPKSRGQIFRGPHLVPALKNGGGPGEGSKKNSKPRRASPPRDSCVLRVLRVLLSSRYPRGAEAISASAGVHRSTGYRLLLIIELDSGIPLVRQVMRDPYGGRLKVFWGVDWERLRGMG